MSKGRAKYSPAPDKGGKGKDYNNKGKGAGSQWGRGQCGNGKGKVSAFEDWHGAQGGHRSGPAHGAAPLVISGLALPD